MHFPLSFIKHLIISISCLCVCYISFLNLLDFSYKIICSLHEFCNTGIVCKNTCLCSYFISAKFNLHLLDPVPRCAGTTKKKNTSSRSQIAHNLEEVYSFR